MTWQLGAFTILALALTGGFAWYERQRPDARIVALVATLAAFAALGRVAFAALPNVKPTTDIVLISGYALGGAPGFAVGALAGLSSNFFFGQGPWTPWQMAAWGATGLIGAGLARALPRQLGRWGLAVVCGLVGFAFAAFQDVGDWVNFSDHSLGQLGVYVGKGVGFDIVHAIGCVAFALAFGPALGRSIARFSIRLNVKWVAPAIVALAVCLQAWQTPREALAANTPAGYLLAAQNADGGLGAAAGSGSSALFSGWAALGLAASGYNPGQVRHGGASLADYVISTQAGAHDPGSIERTILALRAGGLSAGGLVSQLQGVIRRDGSVSDQANLTSFAILALRAAGVAVPANTVSWLMRQQDADGGFNYATRGGPSDIDDTAAALEALSGTGFPGSGRAVHFIEAHERPDGGFPSQPGGSSNAQSTAWAVQGLIASGISPARPLSYLRSLIAPDGHVRYSSAADQTPVWVTAQALMALDGKPLPLAPVAPQTAPATAPAASVAHSSSVAARAARHARTSPPGRADRSVSQLAGLFVIAEAIALAPVS